MKLNDRLSLTPSSDCKAGLGKAPAMTGRVIYIHPARRYYVVEFRSTVTGETFREAFFFPDRQGDDPDDKG